jgi:hypothetical protein
MGFQWFLDGILMDFDDLSFKNMWSFGIWMDFMGFWVFW